MASGLGFSSGIPKLALAFVQVRSEVTAVVCVGKGGGCHSCVSWIGIILFLDRVPYSSTPNSSFCCEEAGAG